MFLRYCIFCLCFISHFAFSIECKQVFSQETEKNIQAIAILETHFTKEEMAKIMKRDLKSFDKYARAIAVLETHFTKEEVFEIMKENWIKEQASSDKQ